MTTAPKITFLIHNRYDLATVRRWVCDGLYGFVQHFPGSTNFRAGVSCTLDGVNYVEHDAWADSVEAAIRAAIAEHKAALESAAICRI